MTVFGSLPVGNNSALNSMSSRTSSLRSTAHQAAATPQPRPRARRCESGALGIAFVRMHGDPATRAYFEHRTKDGESTTPSSAASSATTHDRSPQILPAGT